MKNRMAMAILFLVALTGLSVALSSGCGSGGVGSSPPSPGALYFYVDT